MAVSELTATGAGELDAQASAAADDTQIILPLRDTVLFPHTVLPIAIESERNIAAAQAAVKAGRRIGLLLQLDAAKENPTPEELHRIGTIASIVRYVTAPDGTHHLICQGEQRFSVLDFVQREPLLTARIERHAEATLMNPEIEARGLRLRALTIEALQLLPQAPAELLGAVQNY
jgi:ATP-dependent Lon protease